MISNKFDTKSPSAYLAGNRVSRSRNDDGFTVESDSLKLFWKADLSGLTLERGIRFTLAPFASAPMQVRHEGNLVPVCWNQARKREVREEEFGAVAGWSIRLEDFVAEGKSLDCSVVLFAGVDFQTSDVLLRLIPLESGKDAIESVFWPGGFTPAVDAAIIPFMQGVRIPARWAHSVNHYPGSSQDNDFALAYGRTLYMPWFGVEKEGGSAMLILETPEDAGCRLHHPAGGPTELENIFASSQGKMRYPRTARVRLLPHGNYVDMAKSYREYAMENGTFVSLREKIARSPKVERLIGGAILHGGLLYHYRKESIYHQADKPEENHLLIPCEEFEKKLRHLKNQGLEQAYFHLDGWGFRGYDNLEPDSIPVGKECGGAEALRKLNETCHELGYSLVLHQQYRDIYMDAAGFREELLLRDRNGDFPRESVWAGGPGSVICPSFSPEYLRRNNRYFKENGLQLDGTYLDVFAVTPLDECFHPEHPVSRRECKEFRGKCFDYIRRHWGIVSSEEPADWAIPHLDTVHHAPWPLFPNPGAGPAMGIPIPLFNLVYHDALVIPWSSRRNSRGDWGHDENSIPFLSGLLNGGIPYVPWNADAGKIREISVMRDLHRKVALEEMVSHEFCSEDCKVQKTVFSDETEVLVNHTDGSWKIN